MILSGCHVVISDSTKTAFFCFVLVLSSHKMSRLYISSVTSVASTLQYCMAAMLVLQLEEILKYKDGVPFSCLRSYHVLLVQKLFGGGRHTDTQTIAKPQLYGNPYTKNFNFMHSELISHLSLSTSPTVAKNNG
jgi:hypothetical protein